MEHPSPSNVAISTISLFIPFRYKYKLREVWFAWHIIWLPSGKISPANVVEIKRKNTAEIKIGN